MYINIGQKATKESCVRKACGERAGNARYRIARNRIARRELGDGAIIRETDIDLNGITVGEATHLAFREQPIRKEGKQDKLGKS